MTRYEYVKTVLEPRFKDKDELYHHGIIGMKWGIRRFQNEDGSLTDAGLKRYGTEGTHLNSEQKKQYKEAKKDLAAHYLNAIDQKEWAAASKEKLDRYQKRYDKTLKRHGEEHKKTQERARDLALAKAINDRDNILSKEAQKRYKTLAQTYVDKYGDSRIKDLKNFKTTKTGEEYVKGATYGETKTYLHEFDRLTGQDVMNRYRIQYRYY